jgi:hypothetical protein
MFSSYFQGPEELQSQSTLGLWAGGIPKTRDQDEVPPFPKHKLSLMI